MYLQVKATVLTEG